MKLLGKNEHGIRARDLDFKDKQNFAAVEHLFKTSNFLNKFPEALGTKYYLDVAKSAVYSYLDKSMSPAFFYRYWRQWIMLQKPFTLQNNYITSNSYMCVEINAHSLLAYIMIMRDSYSNKPEVFTPWLIGSQSCEQKFLSLRSMTGTFSTMINFSMLSMTQRLHKLAIMEDLQSQCEAEKHHIQFPRLEAHRKKIGHGQQNTQTFSHLTDDLIHDILKKAEQRAKEAMDILGMAADLDKNKMLDTPPINKNIHEVEKDDSDRRLKIKTSIPSLMRLT